MMKNEDKRINTDLLVYEDKTIMYGFMKSVIYFDNKKLVRETCEEAYSKNIKGVYKGDFGYYAVNRMKIHSDIDLNLLLKALHQCNNGCSWDDFLEVCKNVKYEKRKRTEMDKVIGRICKPEFERATDNFDRKTFDFIRVNVSLTEYGINNLCKYINEIKMIVLEKILNSKKFINYGVPINFLRLTKCTKLRDSTLVFVFELKEIGKD